MFNGYNWQTRTLEVRPDRIAPDFDSPLPGLTTPNAGYHSPSYTFSEAFSSRSKPYTSVALDSLMASNTSGLSIPTLPPSLDDNSQGHSLSRPGTAAGNGGRNLFVGNVRRASTAYGRILSFFLASIPLSVARSERSF
jgi:hypothetical protein